MRPLRMLNVGAATVSGDRDGNCFGVVMARKHYLENGRTACGRQCWNSLLGVDQW